MSKFANGSDFDFHQMYSSSKKYHQTMDSALETAATFHVTAQLFKDPEIKEQLLNLEGTDFEWKDLISGKTSELEVPAACQEKLVAMAVRVGLKMRKKIMQLDTMFSGWRPVIWIDTNFLTETYRRGRKSEEIWTEEELLVGIKVAEILVLDQTIDFIFRFKLACDFCLLEHVVWLWQQIPKELKSRFLQENESEDKNALWDFILKSADDSTRADHSDRLPKPAHVRLQHADCFDDSPGTIFKTTLLPEKDPLSDWSFPTAILRPSLSSTSSDEILQNLRRNSSSRSDFRGGIIFALSCSFGVLVGFQTLLIFQLFRALK